MPEVQIAETPSIKTVADRLDQYGPNARGHWAGYFKSAGVSYPPPAVVLVGLKSERMLEVYAINAAGHPKLVRRCPILGASGVLGPKLREGDRQVPEGLYGIEWLNPNSKYRVSMRISYPNAFDRARGAEEGRTTLGGDIMIHGGHTSAGCLAMGDEVSEDLFVLAADVGIENVRVILAPVDFRRRELPDHRPAAPTWIDSVYADVRAALAKLPAQ